jgi:predicted RNA-binding Zn-ribbon protein involved in translation (DUF1610 family)
MEEKIHKIEFHQEFRVCPHCGYEDGFHTMLKQEGDETLWLFICPSCHKIYDVGQRI